MATNLFIVCCLSPELDLSLRQYLGQHLHLAIFGNFELQFTELRRKVLFLNAKKHHRTSRTEILQTDPFFPLYIQRPMHSKSSIYYLVRTTFFRRSGVRNAENKTPTDGACDSIGSADVDVVNLLVGLEKLGDEHFPILTNWEDQWHVLLGEDLGLSGPEVRILTQGCEAVLRLI